MRQWRSPATRMTDPAALDAPPTMWKGLLGQADRPVILVAAVLFRPDDLQAVDAAMRVGHRHGQRAGWKELDAEGADSPYDRDRKTIRAASFPQVCIARAARSFLRFCSARCLRPSRWRP